MVNARDILIGFLGFVLGVGLRLYYCRWNFRDWLYTKGCKCRFTLCPDCRLHNKCSRYNKHRYLLAEKNCPYTKGTEQYKMWTSRWIQGWLVADKHLEGEKK